MQTRKELNIIDWNRREHFEFFMNCDEPFFGIVTEIDCTQAYKKAKAEGDSFFASYLHKSLVAINSVEELRYRVHDNKVYIYDQIHASSTVARADGTFGFTFIPFTPNFESFNAILQEEIKEVQEGSGLRFMDKAKIANTVHYSSLPWTKITSLSHARNFKVEDSSTKITFGKMFVENGKKKMAVAIHAHHALADGWHVSKFLEQYQELLNQ